MSNVKLLPCPFCGMEPEDDLIDTLYRSGILWRDHVRPDGTTMRSYHGRDTAKEGDGWCWGMNCTQNQGGCGAEIGGDSREEAIARWNTRPSNMVTLTKYVLVYCYYDKRYCFSSIKPTLKQIELADSVFAPGSYPKPIKERYGMFYDSHPNVPNDDDLIEMLGVNDI